MRQTYHTIIVGGGPAGMACAITLQRAGISNCVLERAVFPRSKTCGGLVTEKSTKLLMQLYDVPSLQDIGHLFVSDVQSIMLCDRTLKLVSSKIGKAMHLTRRYHFDSELVKLYRSLGGELRENTCRYKIDYVNSIITLEDGTEIAYQYLVGADGANSRIRRSFGIHDTKAGFCVETYVPKTSADFPDMLSICFGVIPNGYLWVFPVGDQFCIGLGNAFSRDVDYCGLLNSFLQEIGVTDPQPFKGAFVPYGVPTDQRETPDHLMLAGDASGLVDPISGEGIYAALFTGIQAAETIASGGSKTDYLQRIEKLTRIVNQGYSFQKRFYKPDIQSKFKTFVGTQRGFLRYFCDHQVSCYEYEYAQIREMLKDYYLRFKR